VSETETVEKTAEKSSEKEKTTFGFQAEIKQLLQLMIHALYSNKEIFLRELISNASDAADKLRFEGMRDPMLTVEDPDLKIQVYYDKDAKTITIRDNGIGMSRDEIIQHLGTIAKSGTREFLNGLSGDKSKDAKLIGQFGVGFYSAFIVADTVEVITRKAGASADAGVRWSSRGEGEYEVESVVKHSRGTDVILHLKEEEEELLSGWQLRRIITKYSDHITLPIWMKKETPAKTEESETEENFGPTEEIVNQATALWTLSKADISDDQYRALYQHIAHDFEAPLTWSHNKVEGKLDYTYVLYIPQRVPFDLYHTNKAKGLKLYVQRVFIMDDAEQFLPNYLRFVRGIVDSNDLPLNVSRELLQNSRQIDSMRSAIVKRVLTMLESLAKNDKEKYQIFWKAFGQVMKEGPAEDFANKQQIAKLLRFSSTHTDNEQQDVPLEDYFTRMPSAQKHIYFVAAETFNAAKNSPHLEVFRKKGIEVLLLSDRVDEWLTSHLQEFEGKTFQSVSRGSLDLGELDEQADSTVKESTAAEFADVITKMKTVLGDKVKDIRLTDRLTDSPACIVVDEHDMSPQMERLMQAAGQSVPAHKPILELNPEHLMVKQLKQVSGTPNFDDWTWLLLDQAVLAEGGHLDNPASFVKRFNQLLLTLVVQKTDEK
jgi:molecular chaperone HtpG